jgi:hypothetical protein
VNGVTHDLALDATRVPPKIASRAERNFILPALGSVVVLAMGGLLFWFDPAQYRLYPFCFFHELTGRHCPGCGGTRALHQLLHGNVVAALRLNALFVAALPFLAWLGIRSTVKKIRLQSATRRISPVWFWLFLALALVFTVLRNLPAFAWLAP